MYSEASKGNKWKNQFIFQLKYFLNVIRIQRAFRNFKQKSKKINSYDFHIVRAVIIIS